MKNGQDDNTLDVLHEEYLVWKSANECAADDAMDLRKLPRVPPRRMEYRLSLIHI